MFEYSIQPITNGAILTAISPDLMKVEKTYYFSEYQAYKALKEIIDERIEVLAEESDNALAHPRNV